MSMKNGIAMANSEHMEGAESLQKKRSFLVKYVPYLCVKNADMTYESRYTTSQCSCCLENSE